MRFGHTIATSKNRAAEKETAMSLVQANRTGFATKIAESISANRFYRRNADARTGRNQARGIRSVSDGKVWGKNAAR